jgi:hypothetical protein
MTMPYIGRKLSDDAEPVGGDHFTWTPWAVEKIRAHLRAGGPPPAFKHPSPWAWIGLHGAVSRDEELRDRVVVDFRGRRIEWCEPADHDDEP